MLRVKAAVLAALLVGLVSALVVAESPAHGCSMAGISLDFSGRAVEVGADQVTYQVDSVRPPSSPFEGQRPVEVGDRLSVGYDSGTHLIHVGEHYRVQGWDLTDGYASQIAYDFHGDCGTGQGTAAEDGSFLGPGPDRPYQWILAVGGGIAVLVAVALLVSWADARWNRPGQEPT